MRKMKGVGDGVGTPRKVFLGASMYLGQRRSQTESPVGTEPGGFLSSCLTSGRSRSSGWQGPRELFCTCDIEVSTQAEVSARPLETRVNSPGPGGRDSGSSYLPQRVYPMPRLLWECWAILGEPEVPLVK